MKSQKFGVEIELTGLTRKKAAEIIAEYFGKRSYYIGGTYEAFGVKDGTEREWKCVSDSSIYIERSKNNASEAVEVVTPILNYGDIETLQEIIRRLRKAGAVANRSCGIHVHVDASEHNAKTLRNLVNIWTSKQDLIYKALLVDEHRMQYCKKLDICLANEINRVKPKDKAVIEDIWYKDYNFDRRAHYNQSRYHGIYAHKTIMQRKSLKPHKLVGFRKNTQHNFRGSKETSLDQDYHSSQAKSELENLALFFSKPSVLLRDLLLHKFVWFLRIHDRENLGCR